MYYYGNDIANEKQVNVTDISSLTYIVDVYGEATIWCKMSAVTVKEGPSTRYTRSDIPVYGKTISIMIIQLMIEMR